MTETRVDQDRWLVIIRGVPAVGKSTVADALEKMLPEPTVDLNLDDQPPKFPGFERAHNSRFVVGHLYSGSNRTASPKTWLDEFGRRGFHILSVVLDIDLERGWARLANDPKRKNNPYWSRRNYEGCFWRFYNESKLVNFEKSAGIDAGLRIDASDMKPKDIARRILEEMRDRGAGV